MDPNLPAPADRALVEREALARLIPAWRPARIDITEEVAMIRGTLTIPQGA